MWPCRDTMFIWREFVSGFSRGRPKFYPFHQHKACHIYRMCVDFRRMNTDTPAHRCVTNRIGWNFVDRRLNGRSSERASGRIPRKTGTARKAPTFDTIDRRRKLKFVGRVGVQIRTPTNIESDREKPAGPDTCTKFGWVRPGEVAIWWISVETEDWRSCERISGLTDTSWPGPKGTIFWSYHSGSSVLVDGSATGGSSSEHRVTPTEHRSYTVQPSIQRGSLISSLYIIIG
jgi:hypothetical protein